MAKQAENLQDVFLNKARKSGIPLTIHVMNGYQIKNAVLKSFDSYCVLVETEGRQMLIFKHAISSISPQKAIELNDTEKSGKEE